jgi:hypothetical protein
LKIEKARKLKVGDYVSCPADRGDQAYRGQVTHVDGSEYENGNGDPYKWITVKNPWGWESVWPSNRLS